MRTFIKKGAVASVKACLHLDGSAGRVGLEKRRHDDVAILRQADEHRFP